MTPTEIFVCVVMIAIPLTWEIYTLTRRDLRTISAVWAEMGRQWSPFFAYALSALVGHFFVTPPFSLAERLPETAEVFLFAFFGWGIFWGFHANRERLPLPWWGMLLVCGFGFGVGSLVWTLYV